MPLSSIRFVTDETDIPFSSCVLFQILTELEHSGVGRNKEQSARMLGHLVSNAPRLIRPYMEPILKVHVYVTAVMVMVDKCVIVPLFVLESLRRKLGSTG